MDYEIGHINLSVGDLNAKFGDQVKVVEGNRLVDPDQENTANAGEEDGTPIVGWHTDSYPFVCVLMMSDCEGMVGGETALKKADGRVMKIRGPAQVFTLSGSLR